MWIGWFAANRPFLVPGVAEAPPCTRWRTMQISTRCGPPWRHASQPHTRTKSPLEWNCCTPPVDRVDDEDVAGLPGRPPDPIARGDADGRQSRPRRRDFIHRRDEAAAGAELMYAAVGAVAGASSRRFGLVDRDALQGIERLVGECRRCPFWRQAVHLVTHGSASSTPGPPPGADKMPSLFQSNCWSQSFTSSTTLI